MKKGKFLSTVKVEWIEDAPRNMELLEDLVYIDSTGQEWLAPLGSIIDGASIPKFFWRVIGSPFVGLYRRPSVIHDVYCENKIRTYQNVHACFNEMMFTEGVIEIKRETMFNAVDKFGPRW